MAQSPPSRHVVPFLVAWWIMYREGDDVYVQNRLLFMDNLSSPFLEENLYSYIKSRETVNEDGCEIISEWQTNISEIQKWLQSQELKNSPEDI